MRYELRKTTDDARKRDRGWMIELNKQGRHKRDQRGERKSGERERERELPRERLLSMKKKLNPILCIQPPNYFD